jgi:hypothetical protein
MKIFQLTLVYHEVSFSSSSIWFGLIFLDPVKGSSQIWSAKVQVFVHGVVYDVVYDAVNDIVCYVGWNMDDSVGKKVCDTMGGIIRVDMGDMIGE